jgi:hypothetical protein
MTTFKHFQQKQHRDTRQEAKLVDLVENLSKKR